MLEEALADFDGTVLVVSHDRYFLDRICDQIAAFEDGAGIFVQPGNYSYYLEKKKQRMAGATVSWPAGPKLATEKQQPASPGKASGPRKLTFKEQREFDGMED